MKNFQKIILVSFAVLFGYVFVFQVIKEPIIVLRYKLFIIFVTILILAFLVWLALKKNNILHVISLVVSGLLAIFFIAATGVVNGLGQFVVATGQEQLQNVLIVIPKESQVAVNDLKNQKVGMIYSGNDIGLFQSANTTIGSELVLFENYQDLFDALTNKKVKAVFVKESDQSQIREIMRGFDYETRVLKSIAVEDIYKKLRAKDINRVPYHVYINIVEKEENDIKNSVHVLLTVNPKTQKALLTKISSNALVKDACGNFLERQKLNLVNRYGVDCSMRSIGELLNININYYVHLEKKTLGTFVELVKGVRLITTEETYHREEILSLLEEEDNQITVLLSILAKLQKGSMLVNFDLFTHIFASAVKVNFTPVELSALIAYQLEKNPQWTIESQTLTGAKQHNNQLEIYQYSVLDALEKINQILDQ